MVDTQTVKTAIALIILMVGLALCFLKVAKKEEKENEG